MCEVVSTKYITEITSEIDVYNMLYAVVIAHHRIDEFQINEINVDLRTSGFDNEVLSVDACAVW